MKISDILENPEVTQQEMEFLVEEYIFAKKAVRVKIQTVVAFDLGMLFAAFWISYKHFINDTIKTN